MGEWTIKSSIVSSELLCIALIFYAEVNIPAHGAASFSRIVVESLHPNPA